MAALLKDWPTGLGLLALTLVTFHFAVAAPAASTHVAPGGCASG